MSGLVVSMMMLPSAWPAMSAMTAATAPYGTARMTTSAPSTAAAFVSAALAPMAVAASRALSGLLALRVTSCPARVSEVPRALPTLPAPMMATFMVELFLPWFLAVAKGMLLMTNIMAARFALVNT